MHDYPAGAPGRDDRRPRADQRRRSELRCGLARNPALPPSLVDQLTATGDSHVWQDLAERDDLSRDQVLSLARRGGSAVVVRLLARGLLAPDQVDSYDPAVAVAIADLVPLADGWARRVAAEPDPAIRAALATTAHVPPDVIATLADDPVLDVVTELAGSPRLTEAMAERLATHPHLGVRRAVASNEHAPARILATLANRRVPAADLCQVCDSSGYWVAQRWRCDGGHLDAQDDMDCALAHNPRTPPTAISGFATHPATLVRWGLAARTDLPPESYRSLIQDPIPGIRGEVAENPAVDEGSLRTLAGDPSPDVRRRLAHHPGLPLDLLATLATSTRIGPTLLPRIAAATPAEATGLAAAPDPTVRMLLAQRHDLPRLVVDQLARDPDAKVLASVATNPALTDHQLRRLVAHHEPRVAARVAANPACPAELLTQLARQTPPVRKALRRIAAHPNAPAPALLACLTDPGARPIAASHPALPASAISQLLADPDLQVAAAAAANPSLPEPAMRDLAGH